jgi:hypothetical protein
LHERLSGRLSEDEFERYADDAVRLAVAAQERAGADVVTDGKQRRDSYASFVATRLDHCQLIPITDLLPYVTDPATFAGNLKSLDVPAERFRHPAVFGKLGRSRPLAGHELTFARAISTRPIKVALPGPYLLTRTMWLECVSDKAYPDRESLAADIVRILRAEAEYLIAGGAAIVQFDEPVLTEVVFARAAGDGASCAGRSARAASRPRNFALPANCFAAYSPTYRGSEQRSTYAAATGRGMRRSPSAARTPHSCPSWLLCPSVCTSWNSLLRGPANSTHSPNFRPTGASASGS